MLKLDFKGSRRELEGAKGVREMCVSLDRAMVVEGPNGNNERIEEVRVSLVSASLADVPLGAQVTVSGTFAFKGSSRDERKCPVTRLHLRWACGRRTVCELDAAGRVSYVPRDCKLSDVEAQARRARIDSLPLPLRKLAACPKPQPKGAPATTEHLRGRAKISAAAAMFSVKSTRGGKPFVAVLAGDDVCVNMCAAAEKIGCNSTSVRRAADRRGAVHGVPVARLDELEGRRDLTLKAAALVMLAQRAAARDAADAAQICNDYIFGGDLHGAEALQLYAAGRLVSVRFAGAWILWQGGQGSGVRDLDGVFRGSAPSGAGGSPCVGWWPDSGR